MLRFEVVANVFVEVSEDSFEGRVCVALDAVNKACKALASQPYEATREIEREAYSLINSLMNEVMYDRHNPYADKIKNAYWRLTDADDDAYRHYSEASFREYSAHRNESDFDSDFYSDWHKDIYGYRP